MENKKRHNPIKLVRLKLMKMENWFGKIRLMDIQFFQLNRSKQLNF